MVAKKQTTELYLSLSSTFNDLGDLIALHFITLILPIHNGEYFNVFILAILGLHKQITRNIVCECASNHPSPVIKDS